MDYWINDENTFNVLFMDLWPLVIKTMITQICSDVKTQIVQRKSNIFATNTTDFSPEADISIFVYFEPAKIILIDEKRRTKKFGPTLI